MSKKSQILVEKAKVNKAPKVDEKTGELEVFIMGKSYKVPTGLTIMKAIEYAGYRFIRSCGCRAGFCGACSTIYRLEDEQKLGFDLACQKLVEDKMCLVQLPFVPAAKAEYDIDKLKPTDSTLITIYPEIARCVSCNTCTKSCPQDIETMKKHYHVSQLARRLRGKYIDKRSKNLSNRLKEIENRKYDKEIEKLIKKPKKDLVKLYSSRTIEAEEEGS